MRGTLILFMVDKWCDFTFWWDYFLAKSKRM